MSDVDDALQTISMSGTNLETQYEETSSDEEDLSNEDPRNLDHSSIITNFRYDLVSLHHQSTRYCEADDSPGSPPQDLDVNLLIRQLFDCGDHKIVIRLVELLAHTARDRNGRVYVTQQKDTFRACARLLQDAQDHHLKKELLRFFCNACADMSINRERVLQIDGLMERIMGMIGDSDRTLGLFALLATQNVIPKNLAAQQKVKSSNVIDSFLWLFGIPARNPDISIDVVSDLMWSLVEQIPANDRNFDDFKRLLEHLNHCSDEDSLPLFLSVVAKLLQREYWQVAVSCEPDGDENVRSAFRLTVRLVARLSDDVELSQLLGRNNDVPPAQSALVGCTEGKEAVIGLGKTRDEISCRLADMMARSDFHRSFPPDGSTIRALIASLETSKDKQTQKALLVMLGDYANSERICTTLMDSTPIFENIITIVNRTPTNEGVCSAAFGVLRHLLTPKSQRSRGGSLIGLVLGRGLDDSDSYQTKESCLRLLYVLLEGSERYDQIFELTAKGTPYYMFLWDEFSHPATPYKNKVLAARCCVRLLIRMNTAGDADALQQWPQFVDPIEFLLTADVKSLTVEAWYAVALLSSSKSAASIEIVIQLLRKKNVFQNLIESILSQEEAVRSNATVVAHNISKDVSKQLNLDQDKQLRLSLEELVSRPQTVKHHMAQAEAIQLS